MAEASYPQIQDAVPLDERVHGVDRRGGLRALVALVRVFFFLTAVLANKGTVLVELSVPTLPVVHQAVVALVAAHRPVGRCPAALQWFVVLCVTTKGKKAGWIRTSFMRWLALQWSET